MTTRAHFVAIGYERKRFIKLAADNKSYSSTPNFLQVYNATRFEMERDATRKRRTKTDKHTKEKEKINNVPVVEAGDGVDVSDGAIVGVAVFIDKDIISSFVGVAVTIDDEFIVSFLGVGVTIVVTPPAAVDGADVLVCGLRVSAGMSVTSW